jgi:hypothetical protein
MLYSPSKGRNLESAVVPAAAAVHPGASLRFQARSKGGQLQPVPRLGICRPTDFCSHSFHVCSTVLDAQHLLSLLSSHCSQAAKREYRKLR